MATQIKGSTKASTYIRGYSSGVEHLTADQEVPGSNPGAPSSKSCFSTYTKLHLQVGRLRGATVGKGGGGKELVKWKGSCQAQLLGWGNGKSQNQQDDSILDHGDSRLI